MTTPTEPTQARPRSLHPRRSAHRRTGLLMALLVLLTVTATAVTRTTPAGASTPPPWEPDAVNEAGTLSFYDASGHVITSGNINDPIAAYAQGSAGIRTGDTKALLYGFTPVNGVAVAGWTGEALTPSTPYGTGVTYPGDLAGTALPVVTGHPSDETLAAYIADVPNNDTSSDGYAGIYQLRLQTTQPGFSVTPKWDAGRRRGVRRHVDPGVPHSGRGDGAGCAGDAFGGGRQRVGRGVVDGSGVRWWFTDHRLLGDVVAGGVASGRVHERAGLDV